MKLTRRKTKTVFGLTTLAFFHPYFSYGAGLEKAVIWSGKYAGVGTAVTSAVQGPESLFFNPAGLANAPGFQTSLNFSPTFSKFSAPVPGSVEGTISSTRSFSPPGAALFSYGVTPQLGVGLGYYVSGGTRAIYENVAFTGFPNNTYSIKSDITITELSAGAGYEIIDGLRIGAGYRVVFVGGELDSVQGALVPGVGVSLLALKLGDLSRTRWNGFRVGIQYGPKDAPWGIGASWRSEVGFNANATASGSIQPVGSASITNLPGTPATVSATFPWQIQAGGFYDIMPKKWRALFQYDFAQYHVNQVLGISGTLGGTSLPSRPLNWNNLQNVRIGTEYKLDSGLALRAGYIFSSQVTPNTTPSPGFSSPGSGNSFFLGTGATFLDTLDGDIAFEYSRASGTVTAAQAGSAAAGDYWSDAFSVHLGVTYRM
jgi:long-chain fatty acid transport protein